MVYKCRRYHLYAINQATIEHRMAKKQCEDKQMALPKYRTQCFQSFLKVLGTALAWIEGLPDRYYSDPWPIVCVKCKNGDFLFAGIYMGSKPSRLRLCERCAELAVSIAHRRS